MFEKRKIQREENGPIEEVEIYICPASKTEFEVRQKFLKAENPYIIVRDIDGRSAIKQLIKKEVEKPRARVFTDVDKKAASNISIIASRLSCFNLTENITYFLPVFATLIFVIPLSSDKILPNVFIAPSVLTEPHI